MTERESSRGPYGAGSVRAIKRRNPDTGEMEPTGRFVAQASAGTDAHGRRIRLSVTGDSETAAWRALAKARGRKSSSGRRRREGETVAAFLARWLDDVVSPTKRERTTVGYRSIVVEHLVPEFGELEVGSLTRAAVQSWADRQTCAPVTLRHRIDCLRGAMRYAVRWGLAPVNPASDITTRTPPHRVIAAMTPETRDAIIAATAGEWFAPMVVLAAWTGMRQGEMLGLRWDDVDVRGAQLVVSHSLSRLPPNRPHGGWRYVLTPPKNEASRRTIPLVGVAAEMTRDLRKRAMTGEANPLNLVFLDQDGHPVDGPTLTRAFQGALTRSGIGLVERRDHGRTVTVSGVRWHDLRHGTASLLLGAGVPMQHVSAILGHSSISTTVDLYGHLSVQSKREALEQLVSVR